jgi:hypothetical protein
LELNKILTVLLCQVPILFPIFTSREFFNLAQN